MKTASLSWRLTLRTFLLTFALLVACWGIFYYSFERTFARQDHEEVNERVQTVRTLLEEESAPHERLVRRVEKEWAARKFDRVSARVTDGQGAVITETPGFADELAPLFTGQAAHGSADGLREYETAGQTFRLGTYNMDVRRADAVTNYHIDLALERTSEESVLTSFRRFLIFLLTFGALASFWIGRSTVKFALEPIQKISETAHRINSAALDERIPVESQPTEFRDIAETFNAMMDRLEAGFRRLSQFSADISHELRTPVQVLLGSFQVALSKTRSVEEYQNLLLSGVEEGERMKRIIESLLFIARASEPGQVIRKTDLELRHEIEEIFSFYEAIAEEKGVRLESEVDSLNLKAERTLFQRAVGNLLTNSIRHTAGGHAVRLHAFGRDGGVQIDVVDQGSGIAAEDLPRLGDRFFRTEASRSKISGGSGLGLSIVKSIMQIHHGTVDIQSRPGVGTKVSLFFPAET